MTARTHIMFSNAISLALLSPKSIEELSSCVIFSTLGAVLCDLDVVNSETHKHVDLIFFIVSCVILSGFIIQNIFDRNILLIFDNKIGADNFLYLLLFLCFSFYGMHKPHRSFMHSLLGLTIFSSLLYGVNILYVYYFIIGFITHIFLDIFNKKGVQIFYPFKKRYCLKLCNSDGAVNNIIFSLSFVFILYQLFIIK